MGNILRIKINWSGFTGGPGYTNLHYETTAGGAIDQAAVDSAVNKSAFFLSAWRPYQPLNLSTSVDTAVAEVDENTGTIQNYWTGPTVAPGLGASSGVYAAGSGACISLYTADVRNGRRVRGRIFMVPLGTASLEADGTLNSTALTAFRASAASLIDDLDPVRLTVWVRPTEIIGEPFIDGGAYAVTSYSVRDKVAQLRSRRD
jgi:hypothetical protein